MSQSALTTKSRVHFLLGFENLAVDFTKLSNVGEAFFIRCFTATVPKVPLSFVEASHRATCAFFFFLPSLPALQHKETSAGGESQSKEYFLIISAKPELKLGQHLVDGRIVTVNTLVSSAKHR